MLVAANEAMTQDKRDTEALGHLAMRLMEVGTSTQRPRTLILKDPGAWSPEAQNFLQSTAFATCDELLRVRRLMPHLNFLFFSHVLQSSFLKKSPGPQCLIPHVRMAMLAAHKDWKVSD